VVGPLALFFATASLSRRSHEMRLTARSMSQVAIRLAEPEAMAAEQVVTLSQAIRREVASMGDGMERALARASEGYSGAELEQVVVEALFQSFSSPGKALRNEHLLAACQSVIPLSRSKADEIAAIRAWGQANCRMASIPDTAERHPAPDNTSSRVGRVLDI
jgi:hypothetical protein